jgi:hypothetical protein
VDLAGAFDAAFGAKEEEWHPGDKAGGGDAKK